MTAYHTAVVGLYRLQLFWLFAATATTSLCSYYVTNAGQQCHYTPCTGRVTHMTGRVGHSGVAQKRLTHDMANSDPTGGDKHFNAKVDAKFAMRISCLTIGP